MDFKVKGISWVGNVYQKFESMCLEVEDVVCQETAKYVETQVKTVGSSVKKFYAEVLQDLLPPSPKGSERSLEQNAAFGSYEKPNQTIEEISAKEGSATRTSPVKSSCQDKSFEVAVCKKSKAVAEKYPVNKRLLPVEVSDVISSSRENVSQVSLRSRVQKKIHPSSVDPAIEVHSELSMESNSNDKQCQMSRLPNESGLANASLPLPGLLEAVEPEGNGTSGASCGLPEADSAKSYSNEIKIVSCSDRVVENESAVDSSSASQPSLVLLDEPRENQVVENGKDISDESNVGDTLAISSYALSAMEPSWITTEQSNNFDNDASRLDDGDDIVELAPELVDEFHNAKLYESCIVVDPKELHFVPHQHAPKHRSYKRKIRDALASRMRLANKQEYEQLAIWHQDSSSNDNSPNTETCSSSSTLVIKGLTKSQSKDNGESEWELL